MIDASPLTLILIGIAGVVLTILVAYFLLTLYCKDSDDEQQ